MCVDNNCIGMNDLLMDKFLEKILIKDNVLMLNALFILVIFHVVSIANMFRMIPLGALTSGLILISIIINYKVFIYEAKIRNGLFIAVYLIILLSILNYALNDVVVLFTAHHDNILTKTFSYLIIPPLFFYTAGCHIEKVNPLNVNWIFDKIVFLNAASVVIGIILFLTVPQFYKDYVALTLTGVYSVEQTFYPRMFGYFGNSMMLGIICSSSIPLTFFLDRSVLFRILFVVIFIIGSIMTLQRGSIMTASAGLVLCLIFKTNISSIKRHAKSIVFVFLFFLIAMQIVFNSLLSSEGVSSWLDFFDERFLAIGSIVTERSYQWKNAVSSLADYPFGMGIGMLSHVTAAEGFQLASPDGNYFRILGELGFYGFMAFILLLARGILRGLVRGRPFLAIAVLVYAVQAVGTNVFDFYYTSFIFWMLLGILSATNFKKTKAISTIVNRG